MHDGKPFVPEELYQRYLGSLLAGDRRLSRESFEVWLNSDPDLRSLYENLVRRSLYEVGELWETGRISVAVEHLATAITESLLNLTYPRLFERPRLDKSAIVSCVANEYHQIGGKMVADVFELNSWRGYFLGANAPLRDLMSLVEEKRPDVVALSVAVAFNLDALLDVALKLRSAFPDLPIIVGGQALRWGGRERFENISGVRCLSSLGELELWIQGSHDHA
ncbi:MAG: cobalamin-dependent protein [Spirochaetota bacterium]